MFLVITVFMVLSFFILLLLPVFLYSKCIFCRYNIVVSWVFLFLSFTQSDNLYFLIGVFSSFIFDILTNRKLILIIHGLYICKFACLPKFICNPQIGICSSLMVICGHAQSMEGFVVWCVFMTYIEQVILCFLVSVLVL